MRAVIVTGGNGFIGRLVGAHLQDHGDEAISFDLPDDVLTMHRVHVPDFDACIHLAAHKHAPYGEEYPAEVAELNIVGTQRVVEAYGPNVVLASTCKAADPMTVYGASKLIAERIVLNAGGRVVRLVNVFGSSGSVVRIWDEIPEGDPLPVAPAYRYWMTPDFAAMLLVKALDWPSGRYAPHVVDCRSMEWFAETNYPGRETVDIPLRRGDRPVERLVAEYERWGPWREPGVIWIEHPADTPADAVAPTDVRRAT